MLLSQHRRHNAYFSVHCSALCLSRAAFVLVVPYVQASKLQQHVLTTTAYAETCMDTSHGLWSVQILECMHGD